MKAILVEELQEAMKNALVDAWKEVEGLKAKAASEVRIAEMESMLWAFELRSEAQEMLDETTNNS
jgi:hypothetical protein